MRVCESHPLGGQLIDVWSRDLSPVGIVALHISVAKVIGINDDYVREARGLAKCFRYQADKSESNASEMEMGDDQAYFSILGTVPVPPFLPQPFAGRLACLLHIPLPSR